MIVFDYGKRAAYSECMVGCSSLSMKYVHVHPERYTVFISELQEIMLIETLVVGRLPPLNTLLICIIHCLLVCISVILLM